MNLFDCFCLNVFVSAFSSFVRWLFSLFVGCVCLVEYVGGSFVDCCLPSGWLAGWLARSCWQIFCFCFSSFVAWLAACSLIGLGGLLGVLFCFGSGAAFCVFFPTCSLQLEADRNEEQSNHSKLETRNQPEPTQPKYYIQEQKTPLESKKPFPARRSLKVQEARGV